MNRLAPQVSKGKQLVSKFTDSRSQKKNARNYTPQKFVPTCHFCGKVGHIRPRCFKLHRQEKPLNQSSSNGSHENLAYQVKILTEQTMLLNKKFQQFSKQPHV